MERRMRVLIVDDQRPRHQGMYPVYQSKAHAARADVFLLKGCTAEELQAAIVATV